MCDGCIFSIPFGISVCAQLCIEMLCLATASLDDLIIV